MLKLINFIFCVSINSILFLHKITCELSLNGKFAGETQAGGARPPEAGGRKATTTTGTPPTDAAG